MPDYSKGKIYAIRAPDTDDVYIGATCVPLSIRFNNHKADHKRGRGTTSGNLIERPGAYIELIEEFPCQNKEQLAAREGEVIRATPNCVNHLIPARPYNEYRALWRRVNKEKWNAQMRRYRAKKLAQKENEQNRGEPTH